MEYQTQFEQLAHGILLYNPAYNIRGAIALHHPSNVDTAFALALLQEEELSQSRIKNSGRDFSRSYSKGSTSEQRKGTDSDKPKVQQMTSDTEDKLQTLKTFRKNGLCFRCGEKWSHNHKCPEQIPLHMLEELWDAVDAEPDSQISDSETPEVEESIMVVQDSDKLVSAKCKTFRFIDVGCLLDPKFGPKFAITSNV
jgi:hypothetical protein